MMFVLGTSSGRAGKELWCSIGPNGFFLQFYCTSVMMGQIFISIVGMWYFAVFTHRFQMAWGKGVELGIHISQLTCPFTIMTQTKTLESNSPALQRVRNLPIDIKPSSVIKLVMLDSPPYFWLPSHVGSCLSLLGQRPCLSLSSVKQRPCFWEQQNNTPVVRVCLKHS